MISNASICCVTRIVPNSEAMFEPTLPDRIKHMMEEENSNNMISRVVYPATQRGIHGLSMFTFIWMQITAPMKKEISRTIPMESTPNCVISFTYCFQNMRKRSGTLNVRPINIRYLPNVASAFIINIICCLYLYLLAKLRIFLLTSKISAPF